MIAYPAVMSEEETTLMKSHQTLTMTVNGQSIGDARNYAVQDGDVIILRLTM
jgi:hypothetical protein